MKLNTTKQDLNKALTQAAAIVERKNTVPILAHIKLTATDMLAIEATDLDITFATTVIADVSETGACTVDAHLFAGIVKKLPSSDVYLTETDGFLTITCGRSEFQLATLPVDDYPVMASSDYDVEIALPAIELKRLLHKTAFAMSTEETRYYLNGVYLHTVDGKVMAVATDGHRLASISTDIDAEFTGVIIPRKTVGELSKILEFGDVQLSISEAKMRVVSGPITITSKVIDGTFPDYKRIIPTGSTSTMSVDAGEFKASTERVSLVSQEKARVVCLDVSDGMCELSVSGGNGVAKEELAITLDGEPVSIGFNSKYLAEIMQQCSGDTVDVFLKGSDVAAIIRPSDDDGFMVVVMPMRV